MEKINRKIHKMIAFLAYKRHSIFLIISVICLLLIFFNLINFNVVLGFSENLILETFYHILVTSAMVFVILFLPSYPLFFIIFKKQKFNFLEKLGLTFICNLSFYILIGYFGFLIGFLLTGFFFFFTLIIAFFSIIGYIVFVEVKNGKYHLIKTNKSPEEIREFEKSFSLYNYFKNKISLNQLLLIIFIILLCVYSFIRFDFFYGTDPWYHLYITKLIIEDHFLAFNEYLGAMGIHIFGAVIYFFSNIELLIIPKYFVFYTFPISGLIIYNLFMKIFKNNNLAAFGILLIEGSMLGLHEIMLLYWPTSLALILCLQMLFLLYNRLKNFVKPEKPLRKQVFANIFSTYVFIILFFIASLVTHSLNTFFFLISFLFLFLIYFIKDKWRGFDFLLICLLLGIFLIFYGLNLSVGHINEIINYFVFVPLYYIIFTSVILIIGGAILIRWIKNQIKFAQTSWDSFLNKKRYNNHKKKREKNSVIIISIILIFQTLFFLTGILWWFSYENLIIVCSLNLIVIIITSLYGIYYFKKKPEGMIMTIWGVSFAFILLFGTISQFILNRFELWGRIFSLISVLFTFGILSYLYIAIIKNSIKKVRFKAFILSLILFSIFANFSSIFVLNEYLNIDKQEWSLLRYQMRYTSDKNVIITEFGWKNVFLFYEFPYEENNRSLTEVDPNIFILANKENIFPENHILENGTNILKQLKKRYNTDVYLIIPEFFPVFGGFEFNAYLTAHTYKAYYSLEYLNRISSSKSENGIDKPCYWVI